MTLGERLRAAREAAGLTQAEAAERANMTRSHWADLEQDRTPNPGWYTVERAAKAVGLVVSITPPTEPSRGDG